MLKLPYPVAVAVHMRSQLTDKSHLNHATNDGYGG